MQDGSSSILNPQSSILNSDIIPRRRTFHMTTSTLDLAPRAPLTVLSEEEQMFQESVRGYWRLVYPGIVTATPGLAHGAAAPPPGFR